MNDEQSIFAEAIEKSSPQERSTYLDAACAGDPRLRARVDALLAGYERAGDFLESPSQVRPLPGRRLEQNRRRSIRPLGIDPIDRLCNPGDAYVFAASDMSSRM